MVFAAFYRSTGIFGCRSGKSLSHLARHPSCKRPIPDLFPATYLFLRQPILPALQTDYALDSRSFTEAHFENVAVFPMSVSCLSDAMKEYKRALIPVPKRKKP